MIVKDADDKSSAIDILKGLQNRQDCSADTKKRIEQEIRNIQAGCRGEAEAAYEMKVHWGQSKNWMVIHDLRLEVGDTVAQIDHLIINRFLEIWVCESKRFSEGVAINDYGEFSAFFGGKPYGIASPIEQNAKHILLLKRCFEAGLVPLPTRLGFALKPDLKGLVLVSKNARISRPKHKVAGIETILKCDQLFAHIDKAFDQNNNPLLMAKVIGQDTLATLASEICRLHKPITFDWAAKFGLSPVSVDAASAQSEVPVEEPPILKTADRPKHKLVCHACGKPVAYSVAKFCWFNKGKFGGNVYCMDCQKTVQQLRGHLDDFVQAYNFAKRLKTLKGLTPYEYICKIWATEPKRFSLNPHHQMPGLNI